MPVAIARRPILRMVVLCALYVAQGMPYGFVYVTLAAYLAENGASAGDIGNLTALAGLPWTLKFLWGPLLDRFSRSQMGKRRPWILFAQIGMVSSAAAVIGIPELRADLELLGWLVLAHNIFASLQDVSVDALAVDLLPEDQRGFASGLMYGSSYAGIIIGGAGLSTVLGEYGLRAALVVEVAVLTGIMLFPLLLRERTGDRMLSVKLRPREDDGPNPSIRALFGNLLAAYSRRSPLLSAALAVTVMIGAGALTAIGTVLIVQELGWSQQDYGQMAGGIPALFGVGGSVVGGFLADKLGHRRTVAAASVLTGATFFAFAAAEPYWIDRSAIVAFTCANALLLGLLSAALFALFIDVSWPRVAATQFTAFMALLNLSRTIGAKISGSVLDDFGFVGSYVAFGVLQCLVILWLIPLDPHQNRRELGER